jgi:hypothetical protein
MSPPLQSDALTELASYLEAGGWPKRDLHQPLWIDRSGCLLALSRRQAADAAPRIVQTLFSAGNPAYLISQDSPAEDYDLGGLDWIVVGPNAWRVPRNLLAETFLASGLAADGCYTLTIHDGAVPDLEVSDSLWGDKPVSAALANLRSRGVLAVFEYAPHVGWALALPFVQVSDSAA